MSLICFDAAVPVSLRFGLLPFGPHPKQPLLCVVAEPHRGLGLMPIGLHCTWQAGHKKLQINYIVLMPSLFRDRDLASV